MFLLHRLAVLKAIKKEAIDSGESGKILGRIDDLREAFWRSKLKKGDLAVGLLNLLADEISESISPLAETQAKETIDQLVLDPDPEPEASADSGTIDRLNSFS